MGALVALMALAANPQVVQEQLLEAAKFLFPPDAYTICCTNKYLLARLAVQGSTLEPHVFPQRLFLALLFRQPRHQGACWPRIQPRSSACARHRAWWLRNRLVALGDHFRWPEPLAMLALFSHHCGHADWRRPIMPDVYASDDTLCPAAGLAALGDPGGRGMFVGGAAAFRFRPQHRRSIATASAPSRWSGAGVASFCPGSRWPLPWSARVIISKVPQLHAAYGSISAVVVLMLWMLVSAYCLLLGAAVAAVLTEQRLQPELPELE
jgi:hypothetical protein